MKYHSLTLAIAIASISTNSLTLAQDFNNMLTGGSITLNNGDTITTSDDAGIFSSGPGTGVQINGAANISVSTSTGVTNGYGVYLDNGTNNNLGTGSQITVTPVNTVTKGTGIFVNNSQLTASNITITTEGKGAIGIWVKDDGLVNLGANSSIINTDASGSTVNRGIFATNNSIVTADDNLSITMSEGTAVSIQQNASVDVGSNATITSVNGSNGLYAVSVNNGGTFTAGENLQINTTPTGGGSTITLIRNGSAIIGAGSQITTTNTGISLNEDSLLSFTGTETKKNTINISGYSALENSNSTATLEHTIINSSEYMGVYSSNGGTTNLTNVEINANNTGVISRSGATTNLAGNTIINATTALDTDNATIVGSGLMNLTGNIIAKNNGTVDLTMTDGSVFNGSSTLTSGTTNLNMAGSVWNMTGSSQASNINLNNSSINFSTTGGFKTLTADTLSGNGDFALNTNIASKQSDLIDVQNATGSYNITVANNGAQSTNGNERITIVKALDNQASFNLTNNIELGAYEYQLRATPENANNLELYNVNRKVTSTASATVSFLNIGYLTNYIENQTLLQRLGDLRNNSSQNNGNGFWMRSFGGKLSSFSGSQLDGFDMTYWSTQAGIDKKIDVAQGNLFVGAMAGYTKTNPNYRMGDGDGKNYTFGLYATYLLDNGFYIDNLIKYNKMRNHFSVKDTAGNHVSGTGKTQGISLSTEVGKRFWLTGNSGYYIEPQAQLSYAYQSGDSVNASNNLNVKLSHYNSTLARASAVVGYQTTSQNPTNIYLKSGYVREMSGGASYRFNDGQKNAHNFRSGWWDNGVGVNVNYNKQHNVYAELDYSKGSRFDQKQVSLGYRYTF